MHVCSTRGYREHIKPTYSACHIFFRKGVDVCTGLDSPEYWRICTYIKNTDQQCLPHHRKTSTRIFQFAKRCLVPKGGSIYLIFSLYPTRASRVLYLADALPRGLVPVETRSHAQYTSLQIAQVVFHALPRFFRRWCWIFVGVIFIVFRTSHTNRYHA